jgi:hypothetical protein
MQKLYSDVRVRRGFCATGVGADQMERVAIASKPTAPSTNRELLTGQNATEFGNVSFCIPWDSVLTDAKTMTIAFALEANPQDP